VPEELDLRRLSINELLILTGDAVEELRRRKIVRSANNPVGDFAELLFCKAFGWRLATKSQSHSDAIGPDKCLYQIKARRIMSSPGSRQLGALRRLPEKGFDKLAAVLFDEKFRVWRAAIIPHALVLANATHNAHTNSWRFMLLDKVWSRRGVEDATFALRTAAELQSAPSPKRITINDHKGSNGWLSLFKRAWRAT
jgi:hypothetical protein